MLRNHIAGALLWSVSIVAVAGQDGSPAPAPSSEEIRKQYAATLDKAAKDQSETHERNVALMDRMEVLLKRQEEMTKRQEQDADRFEKILDGWERQQAQYQKYLDSLGKK